MFVVCSCILIPICFSVLVSSVSSRIARVFEESCVASRISALRNDLWGEDDQWCFFFFFLIRSLASSSSSSHLDFFLALISTSGTAASVSGVISCSAGCETATGARGGAGSNRDATSSSARSGRSEGGTAAAGEGLRGISTSATGRGSGGGVGERDVGCETVAIG